MYNNRQHKIAQKSFQEGLSNVQDYLSEVGKKVPKLFEGLGHIGKQQVKEIPKAISKFKSTDLSTDIPGLIEKIKSGDKDAIEHVQRMYEQGKDIVSMFAPYIGGDILARNFFKLFKLGPKAGLATGPALLAGGAGLLGAEALMNVAENIKGDVAIYKDYLSDYHKDLDALSKLFPKNNDLQALISVMRTYANDGLKIILKSKAKKKAQSNKNYKIAIVGDANWGSYAHQALSGGAMGAAMGGGPIGAAIGALGMGLADASKDIFHNLQSKEYQAAAYTNELKEKTETLVNQINKYDKFYGIQLSNLVEEFDNYVRKFIYKEKNVKNPKNLLGYLKIYNSQ